MENATLKHPTFTRFALMRRKMRLLLILGAEKQIFGPLCSFGDFYGTCIRNQLPFMKIIMRVGIINALIFCRILKSGMYEVLCELGFLQFKSFH